MPKKKTLEECQELADSFGAEFLSEEYLGAKVKHSWKCGECGTVSERTVSRVAKGDWCPECNKKKLKTKREPITIEQCQEIARKRGGECLSDKYVGYLAKLLWQCAEGHTWESKIGNIKENGTWCPHCAGNVPTTIQDCHALAEEMGGLCMSETFSPHERQYWMCSEGHGWEATFNNIKHKRSWCPHCSGNARSSLEECQKLALNRNGRCLSEVYRGKDDTMIWECSKGHIWKANLNNIKNRDSWCPHCANKARLTIEECQEVAKERKGECLSIRYVNKSEPLEWKCDRGHTWRANMSNVKNHQTWCPTCSRSRSEEATREIMEELLGYELPNCRPRFLDGLELDGYNEEHKVAFEYQGIQHYEYNEHFHRTLENFTERLGNDHWKHKRCAAEGVKLVLVPYEFTFRDRKRLGQYISDQLVARGLF